MSQATVGNVRQLSSGGGLSKKMESPEAGSYQQRRPEQPINVQTSLYAGRNRDTARKTDKATPTVRGARGERFVRQFGFRKGRSTVDAIQMVVLVVEAAQRGNHHSRKQNGKICFEHSWRTSAYRSIFCG